MGGLTASWNRNRCGRNIQISGKEITCKTTSWESCTATAGPECTISPGNVGGKFTWAFKVLKGNQITIGIVTSQFKPSSHDYVNKTKHGWGYYQGDGKIGHGGPASKAYGVPYKVQDGKPALVEGELVLTRYVVYLRARHFCIIGSPISHYLIKERIHAHVHIRSDD